MNYVFIAIYVFLSVSGLVLFKLGSANELAISLSSSFLSVKIHLLSILGLLLYVLSFFVYMGLVSKNDLSHLVPIVTGIVYLSTLVASVVIFKEAMHGWQIVGSLLIIAGVILMNIPSQK